MHAKNIACIETQDPRAVERELRQLRAPIRCAGFFDGSYLTRQWSLEYLAQQYGDCPVKVEVGTPLAADFYFSAVTLGQYIQAITSADQSLDVYLAQLRLVELDPAQARHFSFSRIVGPFHSPIYLFIGTTSSGTSLHYDHAHNVVAQISGHKRWTLYAPEDTPHLYEIGTGPLKHFSQMNDDAKLGDFDQFPEARRAQPLMVDLNPGDLLLVPRYWWHSITSLDPSISANVFWKTLPQYLLQLLAMPLGRLRGRVYASDVKVFPSDCRIWRRNTQEKHLQMQTAPHSDEPSSKALVSITIPYLACGGYPSEDAWIFLTAGGKIKIKGCNDALATLLPFFDGTNELATILDELARAERTDILRLIDMLAQHQIIVDANHLYQSFHAYARYPAPFSTNCSHEENVANYYDLSHLPPILGKTIKLPIAESAFSCLTRKRTSCRSFSGEGLTEKQVFNLAWNMYGRQDEGVPRESPFFTFTVPSGGGLYPLFLYLLLFKPCGTLGPGTYLWHKEQSLLETRSETNPLPAVSKIVIGVQNATVDRAAGMICIVADFERSANKYGNHAYNLALLEAGHLMQNAYLYCAENKLGMLEVYGFTCEPLAELLRISLPDKSPLIAALFGKSQVTELALI